MRGKTDADPIAALLDIADSRFQEELLRQTKAAGKLPRDHRIHRNNSPQALERALGAPAPERAVQRISFRN